MIVPVHWRLEPLLELLPVDRGAALERIESRDQLPPSSVAQAVRWMCGVPPLPPPPGGDTVPMNWPASAGRPGEIAPSMSM